MGDEEFFWLDGQLQPRLAIMSVDIPADAWNHAYHAVHPMMKHAGSCGDKRRALIAAFLHAPICDRS